MYKAVFNGKLSGNGEYTKRCQQFFEERYGFRPAIYGGVLGDECAALLRDFFRGLRNADGI